jgi:hypothetical protein
MSKVPRFRQRKIRGQPLEVKWTQIDTDSYIYIKGTWKIRSI